MNSKKLLKRISVFLLSLVVAVSTMVGVAFAEEVPPTEQTEPVAAAITLTDGNGITSTLTAAEIEAAESVAATFTKNGKSVSKIKGTFYSIQSILENAGVSLEYIEKVDAIAADGFTSSFTMEDLEQAYLFDMGKATNEDGTAVGTEGKYQSAVDNGTGKQWGSNIVSLKLVKTPGVTLIDEGVTAYITAAEIAEAESVKDTFTKNGKTVSKITGTFYKLKSILENAGCSFDRLESVVATAPDEFQSTFDLEEFETAYLYDTGKATYEDGTTVGTDGVYQTAIDNGRGNKWGDKIVSITLVKTPLIDIADATVIGIENKTYTGKAITQNMKVTVGDAVLVENTDYTVAYKNNKKAGTAKVMLTGIGAYTGTYEASFKIAPAANTIKVTPVSKKLSAKTLKSKAQTFTLKATVKEAAKVTFAKVKATGKANKLITVAKNGKVTVKKGLAKGTYTLTVKASAAKTADYKAASKTQKIKIVVK